MKSLLTFGQRTGFLVLSDGAAVKLPPRKDTLAERILHEADVQTLLALEPGRRNRVLLRLLYRAGLRVNELAGLCWRDVHARDDGGQVTVFGKGGKTRTVLLPTDVWRDVVTLGGDAGLDDPVFRSRRGCHLDPSAIFRIVRHAAELRRLWEKCRRTGCATPTPPMPSSAARPSTWSRPRSARASVATTGRHFQARPTDSSARYTSG